MTVVEVVGAVLFWALAGALLGGLVALLADGRPRWLWRSLAVVAGLVALWILGDLFHALLMRRCYDHWEAEVKRDGNGVREGCAVFQEGEGTTALLLIHGFADSPAVYRPMAGGLAKKGYACHTLRLRTSRSPRPLHRQYRRWLAQPSGGETTGVAQNLFTRHRRRPFAGRRGHAGLFDRPSQAADGVVLLAPLIEVSNQRSPLLTAEQWFHILDGTLIFTDRIAMLLPPDVRDQKALAQMKEDRFIPRTIYREMFKVIDRNRERNSNSSCRCC